MSTDFSDDIIEAGSSAGLGIGEKVRWFRWALLVPAGAGVESTTRRYRWETDGWTVGHIPNSSLKGGK